MKKDGFSEAQKIKKKITTQIKNIDILGPVSSPIFKIKNAYRTRLLLRFDRNLFAQKLISKILKKIKISKKNKTYS